MDSQTKNGNFHIKQEETDEQDYESTTHVNGSTIDEQCLLCSSFDASTHKIKVEVDSDDENQRDLILPCSSGRLKTECYYDGEDESINEAISLSKDCEECQALNCGNCPIPEPFVSIKDAFNKDMNSLPSNLSIKESSIPEAGLGVFALQEIPIGTRFGPYKGKKVVKGTMDEFTDTSYMCESMKNGMINHDVDGKMESESNWMRYINCSRTEGEQNLIALQYEDEIYYQALKTIKTNDELLVWYGDEYASGLAEVQDDLNRDDTSCKESTLSNKTVGNHQKPKIDDTLCIMVKCQTCSSACSTRIISKENHEYLEYVCDNCRTIKKQGANNDCFSEVTCNTKATNLTSQLVVTTMAEVYDVAKDVNALNNSTLRFLESKTSTSDGMVSKSTSQNPADEKPANSHIDQHISCPITQSGINDAHQTNNVIGLQCHWVILKFTSNQCCYLIRNIRTQSNEHINTRELCLDNLSTLMKPMRTHSVKEPYKCEICQYASFKLAALKRHMRTHTGEKPYKCDICQYASSDFGTLQRHKRVHSGEKPYKCNVCQYASSHSCHLKRHMRSHSGEKPNICEICQYVPSQLSTLKEHMKTHSGGNEYKCEICQYVASHSGAFNAHMRTHSGEKPYKCEICQSEFFDASHLKIHMRIHNGEKPYKCEICQFASCHLGAFQGHMRTHSGEKPYKCPICQYASSHRGTLTRHMRTHSEDKPYKCEICQYSCRRSCHLKRHMRTHIRKSHTSLTFVQMPLVSQVPSRNT